MTCTGNPQTTPSISCLDFNALWDISGATPQVVITNNSTVVSAANLNWWFYITAPSGNIIYGDNLVDEEYYPTPDVQGVPWTTKTFDIPTPFGNAPCGQIEFSPNVPYTITVFVYDNAGSPPSLQSYSKTAIIVRPNGNQGWSNGQVGTCGNFGIANVSVFVDCANKNSAIKCADITNLGYNNIATPVSTSNVWTMQYPQDPGPVPNRVVNNTPNVNFPATVDSQAYTLYFNGYATYDYGNGMTVKVQYKLYNKQGSLGYTFAINCNVNLCQLICQMKALRILATDSKGKVEYPDLLNTITLLNLLFAEILASIMQPLCGNDVPGMIAEWKSIAKVPTGDCGCGQGYFGFGNPTNGGDSGFAPLFVAVYDLNTSPPGGCLQQFHPSDIYDPTGTSIIGNATSVSEMLYLINSNAAWQHYGTAFDSGSCLVGFFPLNAGITIPVVKIASADIPVDASWQQGGNSFGTTGVLGTTDGFPLDFVINSVVKAVLRSDSFVLATTPILIGSGTISAPIDAIVIDPSTLSVKVYMSGLLYSSFGTGMSISGSAAIAANLYVGGNSVITGSLTVNGTNIILKDSASAFTATILTAALNSNYSYKIPSGGGTFQMRKQVVYSVGFDCRSTGATKIFTSDAVSSGRFVVTDVIAITKNVFGGGANAVFNVGFTSSVYADTVLAGTTTNTANSPQFQTLVGNCLSIPNATDVYINITTASTRTLFDVTFYVIGFYELL